MSALVELQGLKRYFDTKGGKLHAVDDINMVFEESTGIRQATTEEIGKLLDIYSINGQMVKKGSDSTLGLPAGVYIVNGKKVVIK